LSANYNRHITKSLTSTITTSNITHMIDNDLQHKTFYTINVKFKQN